MVWVTRRWPIIFPWPILVDYWNETVTEFRGRGSGISDSPINPNIKSTPSQIAGSSFTILISWNYECSTQFTLVANKFWIHTNFEIYFSASQESTLRFHVSCYMHKSGFQRHPAIRCRLFELFTISRGLRNQDSLTPSLRLTNLVFFFRTCR